MINAITLYTDLTKEQRLHILKHFGGSNEININMIIYTVKFWSKHNCQCCKEIQNIFDEVESNVQ